MITDQDESAFFSMSEMAAEPDSKDFNSSLLDSLLSSSIGDPISTDNVAAAVAAIKKSNYRKLVAFRNVTSYSMQETLHACPRKFELQKLDAAFAPDPEGGEGNITFCFGHAVGAGVATFDRIRNLGAALLATFLAWDFDLLATTPPAAQGKPKKLEEFHHAVHAIQLYALFVSEEGFLEDYEVKFVEANMAVDLENGYFYIGHADEVLQRKSNSKAIAIKENKTSGFGVVDPILYMHSNQALSYSAIVSTLEATEYDVIYTIYSKPDQRWIKFDFHKPPHKRIHWLKDQTQIADQIKMYQEDGFFPQRGSSCYDYSRPCPQAEICDMDAFRRFGHTFADLPVCNSFYDLEAIEPLDIKTTFTAIAKSQL